VGAGIGADVEAVGAGIVGADDVGPAVGAGDVGPAVGAAVVGSDVVGIDVGDTIGASVLQPHVAKQLSYAYVPSLPDLLHRLFGELLIQSQFFAGLDPLYHVVESSQL